MLAGEVTLDGATVTLTWEECSVEIRAKSGIWFSDTASGILPGAVYCSGELLFAPLALLEDVLGLTCTASEDGKTLYYYEAASWDIPAGYSVPVLMYHAVSDETWGVTELFVRPSEMEAQLQYLQENGFTPIFFSDLSHVEDFEKPVLLTFDDGYKNNYEELFPLLQKVQHEGHHLCGHREPGQKSNFLTWDQAREMVQSGLVAIESHTVTHPDLDVQSRERQLQELEESQAKILEEIGIPSRCFAFPRASTTRPPWRSWRGGTNRPSHGQRRLYHRRGSLPNPPLVRLAVHHHRKLRLHGEIKRDKPRPYEKPGACL